MAANNEMDRLLQTVKVRVPGVIDGALNIELFNAVVEHQRKSNCWQYEASIPLTVDVAAYPIFPPAGSVMVRVLQATCNDAPSPFGDFTVNYPTEITLATAPTSVGDESPLKVLIAIALAAEQVEEEPSDWALEPWMFERFFDAWLDGALSKLYAHPTKPYSNLKLADYHGRRFRSSMAAAKVEGQEGYAVNVRRWRFPSFA